VLLGSVRSNLSLGFDSGSKNQTRFWSKLVPFWYVSRKKISKLECSWVQFGPISLSILIQVLKIRPGFGQNWFPFFDVSGGRVNKLECSWVQFGPISLSVLIQVLKIKPDFGQNWFPFFLCFRRKSKQIGVLLGSVWSNLTFDFDSGSKNQTRFWSKLVPFLYVSRRRESKLECFWVQFGPLPISVLIQALKIRSGSGLISGNLGLGFSPGFRV